MKYLFILILALVFINSCFFLKNINEKAYQECMRAGIHSQEHCHFYAYY